MKQLYDITILMFAIARLSSLIAKEDGIFDIFLKIREYFGVYAIELPNLDVVYEANTIIGKLLKCYWCNSIWVAFFIYLLYKKFPKTTIEVMTPLALSMFGISILNKNN
jgi:Protein of unknown function (DUF1360)